MTQKLEDSGERRTFSTGAVRDRGDLKPRPDLISPHAQLREGMIHTLGSQKYALRNWEQGLPISECLASAQRHIEQYKRGDTNEDHIAQARWNLGAVIHFEEEIKAGRMDPAIDDMPKYKNRPDWETNDGRKQEEVSEDDDEICPQCGGHAVPIRDPKTGIERCPKCGWCVYDCVSEHPEYPTITEVAHQSEAAANALGFITQLESPTFYVAGPMRGRKDLNFATFDKARDRGKALGYNIISPADLDREHGIDPAIDPTVAEHETEDMTHKELLAIIRRDLDVILSLKPERGDGIAVLNGWRDSTGATAEVALARWLGLKVVWASDFHTIVEEE